MFTHTSLVKTSCSAVLENIGQCMCCMLVTTLGPVQRDMAEACTLVSAI